MNLPVSLAALWSSALRVLSSTKFPSVWRLVLFFFVLFVALQLFRWISLLVQQSKFRNAPEPAGALPFFGCFFSYRHYLPHRLFEFVRTQTELLGDTWLFRLPPFAEADSAGLLRAALVTTNPKVVKQTQSLARSSLKDRAYTRLERLAPKSVIAYHYTNSEWAFHRRLLSPLFSDRQLDFYVDHIVEKGDQLLSVLDAFVTRHGTGTVYENMNMYDTMSRATLDIFSWLGFRLNTESINSALPENKYSPTHVGAQWERFAAAEREEMRTSGTQYLLAKINLPLQWRIWKGNSWFRSALRESQRVALSEKKDAAGEVFPTMVGALTDSVDPETGRKLSFNEIDQEFRSLLSAGNATTALSTSFTLYYLAKNPTVQEELYQSLQGVDTHKLRFRDVESSLAVVQSAFYETLRVHPIVPILRREACDDVDVDDGVTSYHIPRGSSVFIPIFLLHRKQQHWGADANEYKPSRWRREGSTLTQVVREAEEVGKYMPFGWGPRACVGRRLAAFEATLLLAILLQKFKFEVDAEKNPPLQLASGVIFFSLTGIHLRLVKRDPAPAASPPDLPVPVTEPAATPNDDNKAQEIIPPGTPDRYSKLETVVETPTGGCHSDAETCETAGTPAKPRAAVVTKPLPATLPEHDLLPTTKQKVL